MDLGEVVPQGDLALSSQSVFERWCAHVRVAVAVAADPLAHAQETRDRLRPEFAFELRVQLRDFAQEGGLVVAEGILDLVRDGELREAEQAGLPKLQHARPDLHFIGSKFPRRERVLGQGARPGFVAGRQQVPDVALGIENALALHLGRVRREHG